LELLHIELSISVGIDAVKGSPEEFRHFLAVELSVGIPIPAAKELSRIGRWTARPTARSSRPFSSGRPRAIALRCWGGPSLPG